MASLASLRPFLLLRRHLCTTAAVSLLNPADPSTTAPPKSKSLAALSVLRSEKDPARILSICRAAALCPDSHPDRAALSLAVSSLSAAGSLPSVRSLLDGLLSSPTSDHLRPHIIVLFGQAGMLHDAFRIFDASASPSIRSLNALLFSCILSKNYDEVARIFRDFPSSYGIIPNLNTYNTVIKAFCESDSSRTFYSILDEMVRMKIKPNLTTFSISLAGFYREERFDDVRRVLWLMKKHRCHPGLSVYNVRIQSLCKLKRATEAKELLKEMHLRRMKPNWVTYDHLILGSCCEGDLEEAKRFFTEMHGRGLAPESSCYFSLIYYLCKGGDFEAALEVCRKSMERNWVPRFPIMKMLVNGLVSISRVEEAREIIQKVKEKLSSNIEMWEEVEHGLPQ